MTKSKGLETESIGLGFRALSDALRLNILDLLRHREHCVCELCDLLDTPQSKLSFHLKVLREAQLVSPRQEGRWVYYSLNLSQIAALEQYLGSFRRSTAQLPAPRCCQ
ncbi:ArsR/SmtB family transcription factor [Baaleninema sp.]|uniref:ArsR/SmtB family transcription factor n=1 Tax=Baaleninema sp. TaxID=3101197 RepID=UPI003D016F7A